MLTRAISGVLLLVVLSVSLVSGGRLLFAMTLLISLVSFYELMKATRVRKIENKVCGIEIVGYLGVIAYYFLLYRPELRAYSMLPLILTIMGMMLVYVLTFPAYGALQVMAGGFAFFYAPIFLSYIYQTRMLPLGVHLVWLIFCASWGCDTCAYCVGMLLGRHKLAPELSPKKTIEGAVGGVAGAALIGFFYAYFLYSSGVGAESEEVLWVFPLTSAVGAVLSQIGDLAASGIKRNFDIKDYGKIIPGHGGIMDRFDSVIVTAPLIYYLSLMLLKRIM